MAKNSFDEFLKAAQAGKRLAMDKTLEEIIGLFIGGKAKLVMMALDALSGDVMQANGLTESIVGTRRVEKLVKRLAHSFTGAGLWSAVTQWALAEGGDTAKLLEEIIKEEEETRKRENEDILKKTKPKDDNKKETRKQWEPLRELVEGSEGMEYLDYYDFPSWIKQETYNDDTDWHDIFYKLGFDGFYLKDLLKLAYSGHSDMPTTTKKAARDYIKDYLKYRIVQKVGTSKNDKEWDWEYGNWGVWLEVDVKDFLQDVVNSGETNEDGSN